jgi:hypothetical protein
MRHENEVKTAAVYGLYSNFSYFVMGFVFALRSDGIPSDRNFDSVLKSKKVI